MNTIKFDNINAYEDLELILSKATINPAIAKTTFVEIPNRDGAVDLSEAMGEIKYKSRTGTFIFYTKAGINLPAKRSEVANALNGKSFEKITLDRDPSYYWTGRITGVTNGFIYPADKITVTAQLDPYKSKQSITEVTETLGTEYKTIILNNSRKNVVPTITVGAETTVKYSDTICVLSAGEHTILDFILYEGENTIQAKTDATEGNTIVISYQEGSL